MTTCRPRHIEEVIVQMPSAAICDGSRATAIVALALRFVIRAWYVNGKKVRRLMREHDLQPRAPASLRGDHRQRPRQSDLSRSRPRRRTRRPEPALGRRYHLHRDRHRLRLSRRDPRHLVAAGRRLRDQPIDRCPPRNGRLERCDPITRPAALAASITPIVARNTHPPSTDRCSPTTAWSGR